MPKHVAAFDLGKVTVSFVLASVLEDGSLDIEVLRNEAHEGKARAIFCQWYREFKLSRCAALAVTGLYSEEFVDPAIVVCEDYCQESALALFEDLPPTLNLVSVGGRGYSVLTREGRANSPDNTGNPPERDALAEARATQSTTSYRFHFLENDKCSSGTGENLSRMAGRFGSSLEAADALALTAPEGIPITARCSVFAKSEMTHYANQGKDQAQLLRGYFESVARNARALLARNQVDGPVYLIGGCTRLKSFTRAFAELCDQEVHVLENALTFDALGAAAIAASRLRSRALPPLPRKAEDLTRARRRRFSILTPASEFREKVTVIEQPALPSRGADRSSNFEAQEQPRTSRPLHPDTDRPSILGLDLGSTGAKAMLVDLETGLPMLDVYESTRGNPIDATHRLVRKILEQTKPDLRAIGVTGSGREAVAKLLHAVYSHAGDAGGDREDDKLHGRLFDSGTKGNEAHGRPSNSRNREKEQRDGRIIVQNEIIAHATAAIRLDKNAGADLAIIEIGGQDAKYIRVVGGRVIESDMNKACSAGTGSFLAEQAEFYDIHEIERFVALAQSAKRPPDLGQMCTVYVAEAGSEAMKEGFELSDIFAGFQYSIIHNYLNRVMGRRSLGATVFFQGKPASNPSLAWTLAAVTGRDVVVPPNPGAMGAWGIALRARQALDTEALKDSESMSLEAVLEANVVDRNEFRCRDPKCDTLCPIERTTIEVGGERRSAISGGACPKYEVSAQRHPQLPREAPDPFAERARLLKELENSVTGTATIAIPQTGALAGYLPYLCTLAGELGFGVRILRSDGQSLAAGEQLCNSFDSCGPTKIAHALCHSMTRSGLDNSLSFLLFPKILTVHDREGAGGQTCVTEQATPEMVELSLKARGVAIKLLRPVLSFSDGLTADGLLEGLRPMAQSLDVDDSRLSRAMTRAARAQQQYDRQLAHLGQETVEWGRKHEVPMVLVCGSLHVIHDPAVNATLPQLLRQNGALAIPVDCLTIPPETPPLEKIYWGDANRYLRGAAVARAAGDIFPLMLSSFGCGPASFTEQVFQSLLEAYPHTILESDGHGGTAGYVTRIQVFLESVRQYRVEQPSASSTPEHYERLLSYVGRPVRKGSYLDQDVRYVFLSGTEYLGPVFAAVYRSFGFDAVAAPPLSKANLACGRHDCSGKECLSYQMVWGAFRGFLEQNPPQKPTRLVQITGQICRAGLFGVKDQISLMKLGLDERVSVTAMKVAGGASMALELWVGLVAIDLIRQLYLYHIVAERRPGEAAELYRSFADQVLQVIQRPMKNGLLGTAQLGRKWRRISKILNRASDTFAEMERTRPDTPLRKVFVSGDILTKGNDFANAGLYTHLATRCVRVVVEPFCDFMEYLARERPHLIFGRGGDPRTARMYKVNMIAIRERMYRSMRKAHPWLPQPSIKTALSKTSTILDTSTNGGSCLAVGSVLLHWEKQAYDGVVLTACWGCDNGLIAESLLRHRRDIPFLFFYDDGSPLDERKVNRFAARLFSSREDGRTPQQGGPRPARRALAAHA